MATQSAANCNNSKSKKCRFCAHEWEHAIGGFCPKCHRFQVPSREVGETQALMGLKMAVNCTAEDGREGHWMYEPEQGLRVPHSPVFAELAEVLGWCTREGWVQTGIGLDPVYEQRNPGWQGNR
jgi:hypothetical protein